MSLSLWIILLLQAETVISTELNHVAMIKNKKGQDKLKYLRAMRDAEKSLEEIFSASLIALSNWIVQATGQHWCNMDWRGV